jgi:hypothetical protein
VSVHPRVNPRGTVAWRFRWRDGAVQRSRDFDRKHDADAFDVEARRRAQLGDPGMLEEGKQKLPT